MNNKKLVIRSVLAFTILIVLFICIYLFITIFKEDKINYDNNGMVIPEIKEDFTLVTLEEKKEINGTLYIDKNTNQIRVKSNDDGILEYIIGEYGKLYETPQTLMDEEEELLIKGYNIYYESKKDKYYFIDNNNNTKSSYYDKIIPLYLNEKNEENVNYFILYDYKTIEILDLNTNEISILKSNIKELTSIKDGITNNNKYLTAKQTDNTYTLINYIGIDVLDKVYQEIKTTQKEDTFIIKENNKYGVITDQNEIKLNVEFDNIEFIGKFIITKKDNKISIYDDNYNLIEDSTIELENSESTYSYQIINNDLYITTYPYEYNIDEVTEEQLNYLNTFKITTKGIERKINSEIQTIKNIDEEIIYVYTTSINESINITIYDLDLYEYYKLNLPLKETTQRTYLETQIKNTQNKDYYQITTYYDAESLDEKELQEYYYIDIKNSKEISEKNALKQYLSNGYSYTLNDSGNLIIYKNDEKLTEFYDINMYLGGYYFLDNDNKINLLEFKKES